MSTVLTILRVLLSFLSMNEKDIAAIAKIRRTHIGRHLFELNKLYKRTTLEYIQAHGFPEMTSSHLHLLSQISLKNGTGTQTVIERVGASKQAVSRTVVACESLGYIERVSVSTDRRAFILRFTPKGLKLMAVASHAISLAERMFIQRMGKAKFDALKTQLEQVSEILDLVQVDKE